MGTYGKTSPKASGAFEIEITINGNDYSRALSLLNISQSVDNNFAIVTLGLTATSPSDLIKDLQTKKISVEIESKNEEDVVVSNLQFDLFVLRQNVKFDVAELKDPQEPALTRSSDMMVINAVPLKAYENTFKKVNSIFFDSTIETAIGSMFSDLNIDVEKRNITLNPAVYEQIIIPEIKTSTSLLYIGRFYGLSLGHPFFFYKIDTGNLLISDMSGCVKSSEDSTIVFHFSDDSEKRDKIFDVLDESNKELNIIMGAPPKVRNRAHAILSGRSKKVKIIDFPLDELYHEQIIDIEEEVKEFGICNGELNWGEMEMVDSNVVSFVRSGRIMSSDEAINIRSAITNDTRAATILEVSCKVPLNFEKFIFGSDGSIFKARLNISEDGTDINRPKLPFFVYSNSITFSGDGDGSFSTRAAFSLIRESNYYEVDGTDPSQDEGYIGDGGSTDIGFGFE